MCKELRNILVRFLLLIFQFLIKLIIQVSFYQRQQAEIVCKFVLQVYWKQIWSMVCLVLFVWMFYLVSSPVASVAFGPPHAFIWSFDQNLMKSNEIRHLIYMCNCYDWDVADMQGFVLYFQSYVQHGDCLKHKIFFTQFNLDARTLLINTAFCSPFASVRLIENCSKIESLLHSFCFRAKFLFLPVMPLFWSYFFHLISLKIAACLFDLIDDFTCLFSTFYWTECQQINHLRRFLCL